MLGPLIEKTAYLVIGVLVGMFLLFLYAACFLNVESLWDFSIYDLLKFIVTLFVAVFIAHYLKNRHSDLQLKKKTFLELLNQVQEKYDNSIPDFYKFMMNKNRKSEDRNRITLLFRLLSNKIDTVYNMRQEYNIGVGMHCDRLRKCHREIKTLITGDPAFTTVNVYPLTTINNSISKVYHALSTIDNIKLKVFS